MSKQDWTWLLLILTPVSYPPPSGSFYRSVRQEAPKPVNPCDDSGTKIVDPLRDCRRKDDSSKKPD